MSDKTSVPGKLTWTGEVEFVHEAPVIEKKYRVIKIKHISRDAEGIHVMVTLERLPDKEGE